MDQRNFQFLFYGLAAVWVILFGYLFVLAQRNRKIRQELERVRRMVNDREA